MKSAYSHFDHVCDTIRAEGLWKEEHVLTTPQSTRIDTVDRKHVLNLCANNYLGLSNHPALVAAAKASYDAYGHGLSSVRFICGTQSVHKQLEAAVSAFLGMEDAILYSSCFDANTGLFETLLGETDAIISDALNHASIIDGVRLCKARRYRYANSDMAELEARLREAADAHIRLIVTDGVFSMDGAIANLPAICDLAEKHDALVMVDDSHAVGFVGGAGAWHPGVLRGAGPGGHSDRDVRQGARWRQRGVHRRPQGRGGSAAAAFPAIPVFQHPRAGHRSVGGGSLVAVVCRHFAAGQVGGEHAIFPEPHA